MGIYFLTPHFWRGIKTVRCADPALSRPLTASHSTATDQEPADTRLHFMS